MTDMNERLVDDFEIAGEWKLDESGGNSVVDGVNILARITGPFFLVDGASRNKRFYSKSLWENAITVSQDRIDKGMMLGTIGHEQSLTDAALLEGKASHRVSKLWIDEGKKVGMGEVLILNTPAGRNLNGYIRGGAQIPVSSRAYGTLNGKNGDNSIVDAKSYKLETFDFVQIPGVEGAVPQLVEEYPDGDRESQETEEMTVSTEVLETVAAEKRKLQEQLDSALEVNQRLEAEGKVKDLELEKATGLLESYQLLGSRDDLVALTESAASDKSAVSKANEKLSVLDPIVAAVAGLRKHVDGLDEGADNLAVIDNIAKTLDQYSVLGTPDLIEEALDKAKSTFEAFSAMGTPSEVATAIDEAYKVLDSYHKFGTLELVERKLEQGAEDADLVETYEELGTIDEITSLIDVVNEYLEFGTPDDVKAYQDLGTPEEIQEVFAITKKIVQERKEAERLAVAETLADKYKVAIEVVTPMLESMTEEAVSDILGKLGDRQVSSRFKASAKTNESDKHLNEDISDSSPSSRVGRLMKTVSYSK